MSNEKNKNMATRNWYKWWREKGLKNRNMSKWLISLKCFWCHSKFIRVWNQQRQKGADVLPSNTRICLHKWKLVKLSVISMGIHVTLFATYFDLGSAWTKCFQIWIEWINNVETMWTWHISLPFSDWNFF